MLNLLLATDAARRGVEDSVASTGPAPVRKPRRGRLAATRSGSAAALHRLADVLEPSSRSAAREQTAGARPC
jgi:hypothetical protein